jgi:hypothetical protein
MADSDEIRRRIFEGVVPVRVRVDDCPVPLCYNAPRCLSLGAFAHRTLGGHLPTDTTALWFSHNSKPLKWQFPIGVIYDAFNPDPAVFWVLDIVVQKADFPDVNVLRCESPQTPSSYFRHSQKESLYITTGGASWVAQFATLPQDVEQAALAGEFAVFSPLFQRRLEGFDAARRWPIKFVDKDLNSTNCLLKVAENPDATFENALSAKQISCDNLVIHGVAIEKTLKIAEVIGLTLYPDGFLYVVTSSQP